MSSKMNDLMIIERQLANVTVLNLAGNIKIGINNVRLRVTFRILIKERKNYILLNLAEVSQIDSSGLGELIAGYVSVKKNGGELKLLHVNTLVRELMILTKLLTVFEIFEDENEAILSFQRSFENFGMKQSQIITAELDKSLIKTLKP